MNQENDMNIILVGKHHGKSRTLPLNSLVAAALVLIAAAVVVAAFWLGFRVASVQAEVSDTPTPALIAEWQDRLVAQQQDVDTMREHARQQVDALTLRLGEMQGRLLRLDAMGQRFVESGLLASDEFNFDQPAAMGGRKSRFRVSPTPRPS